MIFAAVGGGMILACGGFVWYLSLIHIYGVLRRNAVAPAGGEPLELLGKGVEPLVRAAFTAVSYTHLLLLHNHSLFSFQGADKKVHAVRRRLRPPGIVYPLN